MTANHRELELRKYISSSADPDVCGAWDEESFAIHVRGKKYVKALKGFYEAIKAGTVVFAGSFFERDRVSLGGVVLANTKLFGEQEKQSISKAQSEYESKLRLKARDESKAIRMEMEKLHGGRNSGPGYIWPIWSNAHETEVVYGLNPNHSDKAEYLGPYSKKQLLDWAKAQYGYKLTRNQ